MTQIVYATFDAQGQPVEIGPGPFTTWRVRVSDGSEVEALGAELGQVVEAERGHEFHQLALFSAEDLDHYQIARFEFPDAPAGEAFAGAALSLDPETGAILAEAVYEARPLDELKAEKLAAARAEYAARIGAGFPVPSLGEGETLQLRDETDRSNWLALKDSCTDAILAGLGDDPCALPIRSTSNTAHQLTYAEAAQLMRDMRAWAAAHQGALWSLKDAIEAAPDAAALAAIDTAAGWPA